MSSLLTTRQHNQTLYVDLTEDFDGFLVDKVREQLDNIATQMSCDVVMDFSRTQFIDSSGVGAIVFLFKRLTQQQRSLCLQKVDGQPMKLLSMLHVDRAIAVNQNIDNNTV